MRPTVSSPDPSKGSGWVLERKGAKKTRGKRARTPYCLAPDLTCRRGAHYKPRGGGPQRPPGHTHALSPSGCQGKMWPPPTPHAPSLGTEGPLPRSWFHLWFSPAHLLPAWHWASPAGPQIPEKVRLATRSLSRLLPPFPGAQVCRPFTALGFETDLLGMETSPAYSRPTVC